MNILILQGSPRANGNTAWMAEEYRKAAEAAGHKVTLVDVSHKKIAGCMACEYCHGKGNGACIQKDDMQELYPLLAEADVLVLAAPIYYFTLSAQIQAPIQRIYNMQKDGASRLVVFARRVRRRNRRVPRHSELLGRRGHGHRHRQDRRAEDGRDEGENREAGRGTMTVVVITTIAEVEPFLGRD